MGTSVLSLRIDGELLDRLRHHAGIRGMNVQDYVIRALVRNDFDERFKAAVEETQRFYEAGSDEQELPEPTSAAPPTGAGASRRCPGPVVSSSAAGRHAAPETQVSPSAGIR
ncbi:hypothetical protein [Streptomyces mesophilus]|uniref:hypothetical protein n=1 Tax=Streptomyces mesophilus TaxID=1775132 RepID=UPI001F19D43A|nr:hypothetical protein [Streptomyces mesophilus]